MTLCANTQLRRLVFNLLQHSNPTGREYLIKELPHKGWQRLMGRLENVGVQAQTHQTATVISPTVLLIPRPSSGSAWLDTLAYLPKSQQPSLRGQMTTTQTLLFPPGSRVNKDGGVRQSKTPILGLAFQKVKEVNHKDSYWLQIGEGGGHPIASPNRAITTPIKPEQYQRVQRILDPLEALWENSP